MMGHLFHCGLPQCGLPSQMTHLYWPLVVTELIPI